MKARVNKKASEFQPFEITFEFNKIEEYRAFNRAMTTVLEYHERHPDELKNHLPDESRALVDLFKEIKTSWGAGSMQGNPSFSLVGVSE